jgi:hypothetical protein
MKYLVYDAMDDATADVGSKGASSRGYVPIPVKSTGQLKTALDELMSSKARIDELLFYTHGEPGTIFLGTSALMSQGVREFAGRGYEDLFAPGAEIFFSGCKVAAVKDGCDDALNDCYFTDNGAVFLQAVASTFLFKGGGRAGAYASTGFTIAWVADRSIHHADRVQYWAIVKPGNKNARLAIGKELSSPEGLWRVYMDGNDYPLYYKFYADNTVEYSRRLEAYSTSDWPGKDWNLEDVQARGKWRLGADALRIAWDFGGADEWDVPLFSRYSPGKSGLDRFQYATRGAFQDWDTAGF